MKLYEVTGFGNLSEDMLVEGFLDSVKKALGSKIDQAVTSVSNTATALQVFYKVGSNPEYLDTATFLLKKRIKNYLKSFGDGPVITKLKALMDRIFPNGRGMMDFIKCCVLVAALAGVNAIMNKVREAMNLADQAKNLVVEKSTEMITGLISKLTNLDSLVKSLTNASGIFSLIEGIGVANKLLFQTLDEVNKKINSVRISPTT
jgi:hypothetical protein